uniref:Syntaphilin a n=1 Tax=Xiphophorus couchianus TaxID=32473 RepID=A0A3B5M4F7_9TELE
SVGTSGGSRGCSHSDMSSTYTYPGRMRGSDGNPTTKHTACINNHGIKVPAPEQYLTPLQQKEVCIRHLRARLRENVERLQHRDYEIEELRTQLNKMQEDWIKEECHRLETQLALKEARKEIQHLHEMVETVKSNIGVHDQDPHDYKPYSGPQAVRPGGKSRSCGCSPASTLTRGTTFTRRSTEALQLDRNAPEPSGAHHLRPGPAVSRSATCERLCSGGAVLPMSHSCHSLSSSCRCGGHAYLPHHHLFLHLPQEEPPLSAAAPAAVPVPVLEKKPEVRSQGCKLTPSDPRSMSTSLPLLSPPGLPPTAADKPKDVRKVLAGPHTCQPKPVEPLPVRQEATVLEFDEDEAEGSEDRRSPELSHWSRYFLVDLLALAMPVVPTMAWLCRGAPQEAVPAYHIGSLLRGCCAVALHSLRRQGCSVLAETNMDANGGAQLTILK